MENKELEPTEIETYKCLVCDKIMRGTYEKAQKHVGLPRDMTPLPYGLVLRNILESNRPPHIIIKNKVREMSKEDHGVVYVCSDGLPAHDDELITSKHVKENLLNGSYKLLSEGELEEFKIMMGKWGAGGISPVTNTKFTGYGITKFVRSTPELENIVNSKH